MFLHPNSAPLWREYLLFTQSYFSNFTVTKVNAAYGKCLSTLSAVRDGSMVSHPARPGTEEDMLGNKILFIFHPSTYSTVTVLMMVMPMIKLASFDRRLQSL